MARLSIEQVSLAVACLPVLSVTCTVKAYDPGWVGVPERRPSAERLTPGGSSPADSDHVSGAVPPEAWRMALYGDARYPVGREVVITSRMPVAVMAKACEVVDGIEAESRTEIVAVALKALVTVPVMLPVAESVRPVGKLPPVTDQE